MIEMSDIAIVGSQTSGAGAGISVYPYYAESGTFGSPSILEDTENPSFLALDAENSLLYAVQELTTFMGKPGGGIAAYSLKRTRSSSSDTFVFSRLVLRGSVGTYPCHLVLSPRKKALYVSNYGDGILTVHTLDAEGCPSEAAQVFRYAGKGPNAARQECAHIHSLVLSPDGRFALAADLGRDRIIVFRIDSDDDTLGGTPFDEVPVAPGSGPRHFSFSRDGCFLYVVEELSSQITVFSWDGTTGSLRELQTIDTLPEFFGGDTLAADIHIHPDGEFLYCSNRGHDSIALFHINKVSGLLTPKGHFPCGGFWPRNFAIDLSGKFLFAANQKSNSITRFRIDPRSGSLSPEGEALATGEPMFIAFSRLR
jgi:6-phosphogluconolactonase